jgi:hypothetical protein
LISSAHPQAVEAIAARHGVRAERAGVTMNYALAVGIRGATVISVTIEDLKAIYEESLEKQLRS